MANFTIEGDFIKVSGSFDAESAIALGKILPESGVSFLDFSDVDAITFAAQRKLLDLYRGGLRFQVVNAPDSICERFEDTGVSSIISVCRRPKPIDMSKYQEFGGGFVAKSFYSEDGDAVLKYYSNIKGSQSAFLEKAVSKAVMLFGIPTPLVGTLYDDSGTLALDFERINGKRSLSRIMSEEPERIEELSVKFARMCKQLHDTPCDTGIFSDKRSFYRSFISGCGCLSEEDKERVMKFIDSIPLATTCLHGDMQPSNIIETPDGDDLWIDLGDFGYGYPMLDMGMWYFLTHLSKDEVSLKVFHLNMEQMSRIWDIFFKEYFAPSDRKESEAILEEIEKYAALHTIYLGTTFHFGRSMVEFVRSKLGVNIIL